jgi:iron only hydrogenase large subunit-like protein/nitrogen-specific signal transduction histidine kinase
MHTPKNKSKLVYTIKDRCRVCYTCVRECPVKAIKIVNGQAEVIQERCIACGNCTRVCSQGAKAFMNSSGNVLKLLEKDDPVIAILAPSFIAEFKEIEDYHEILGMIRRLGFDKVVEVAFGADMVAREYRKIMNKRNVKGYISSDCPAIVNFIEKYHPELTGNLAPVVSPMIALTRYLRQRHKKNAKIVFIGPCIAKKSESSEVDEQITFLELRELFQKKAIVPGKGLYADFDPPLAGKGAIFPVSRGLLQTINSREDELERNVIVAEGRIDFQDAIREYKLGLIDSDHLELLCCEGCIMGPGTSLKGNKFERKLRVTSYVRDKLMQLDHNEWEKWMVEAEKTDLSQSFEVNDQRMKDPTETGIREVLKRMNKLSEKDHLNCGACGYDTCRNHAIAINKGLAEVEMCLPYTIEKLHSSVNDLAVSNEKLMSVQQALKQTEKLAHMGQLSAGIAHELNNPLGVVIMYANILLEEQEENSALYTDLKLVAEQAERCKSIVGGLLNFARKNQVNYQLTDIEELLRLSLDSVIKPGNIAIQLHADFKDPFAELDQEQMIQVISNLIRNAFEAMTGGGKLDIQLKDNENQIIIKIKDSGTGISESDLQKVFEPFFTTKGIGKGTGLGLATAYGVVKMHKGKIEVESNADPAKGPTFTSFTIILPRRSQF